MVTFLCVSFADRSYLGWLIQPSLSMSNGTFIMIVLYCIFVPLLPFMVNTDYGKDVVKCAAVGVCMLI